MLHQLCFSSWQRTLFFLFTFCQVFTLWMHQQFTRSLSVALSAIDRRGTGYMIKPTNCAEPSDLGTFKEMIRQWLECRPGIQGTRGLAQPLQCQINSTVSSHNLPHTKSSRHSHKSDTTPCYPCWTPILGRSNLLQDLHVKEIPLFLTRQWIIITPLWQVSLRKLYIIPPRSIN